MRKLTSDEIYQIFNFDGRSGKKQYRKVRLKDAWGNSVFAIKGEPPQWFMELPAKVDLKTNENLKDVTIEEFSAISLKLSKGSYVAVSKKYNRSIISKGGLLTEVVALKSGKDTYYVRKCYMHAIALAHEDVSLYINEERMLLCAKKEEKIVAMIAVLDVGSEKIYTPEGALKELTSILPVGEEVIK